ncbi:MAG: hypothetical protein ACXVBB_17685, partial [Isosphaeraceae bacterium]
GLCMDYLHDPETGRPSYIDANPRPGETLNATLSGLNLSQRLVQVALDEDVPPPPTPRPGVRTHTVVMGLMALAYEGAPRRRLLAELRRAWAHHAPYDASQDQTTRPLEDPPSLIPAVYRLSNPPSAPEPLLCPPHRSPHGGQLLVVRGRRAGHPPDPRRRPGPSKHREPITVG